MVDDDDDNNNDDDGDVVETFRLVNRHINCFHSLRFSCTWRAADIFVLRYLYSKQPLFGDNIGVCCFRAHALGAERDVEVKKIIIQF